MAVPGAHDPSSTALALILAPLTACGLSGPDRAGGVGTVAFLDFEGGCWAIESDGERLEPLDLPDEFREDGLRVAFRGEIRDDVATVCQVGPVVELDDIERVD